jgi:adenylosuccinate lyase
LLDGRLYVGRAPEQVLEFLEEEVQPILTRHAQLLGARGEVRV